MLIFKNFCFIEISNIEIIKLIKIDVNKIWYVLINFYFNLYRMVNFWKSMIFGKMLIIFLEKFIFLFSL